MSLSIIPKTSHAPAERASFSRIAEEYLSFCDSYLPANLVGGDESLFMAFNSYRQLIYSNQKLLDFLGLKNIERILGLRLGEIFGCSHATDNLGGCGTQPACVNCCAIQVMLDALAGRPGSDSCCILVDRDRQGSLLRFSISATPFDFKGQSCIAVYLSRPTPVPLQES